MKITAILLLFSLSALVNAAAIAKVTPDSAPTPINTVTASGELEIDLDAITDDERGNVEDTVILPDDEEKDTVSFEERDDNHGIVTRGDVEDETILERDELPNGLERRESLWERALATLQRRETPVQATDRLCFGTNISNFLRAKADRNPNTLDWTDDGCSHSPDRPGGFNFLHSCQRHDFGYRNFKKQNRFNKDNRLRIDNQFKSDLDNECEKHGIIKRTACKGLANTYYLAVRAAGGL